MTIESSADIKRYLLQKCSTLGIPVSGIFELTPRCNLKCKMCYVRLTKEQMAPLGRELTADEWIELGQQCKDAGMAFLLITGGEPTIRKDFAEIYSALAQMGLSITVNTNATNLSDEIKELWQKLPPAQVNVTVYGVCREDYGDLCQNPDAFDKVQENLQWLKNQGILVHLNTTVVPVNYPKWTEIEEFAKNGGYELRITTATFTVNVKVALTAKKQESIISDLLERVLPYEMVFTVELLYNTWAKVLPYTWSEIGALTWKQVKEEVLP